MNVMTRLPTDDLMGLGTPAELAEKQVELFLNSPPFVPPVPSGQDATERIQAYLDRYGLIQLKAREIYEIRSTIILPTSEDTVGIIGNGATIYMPAAYFNNTSNTIGNRYGTNAVGIKIPGSSSDVNDPITNVILDGLQIIGDFVDGTLTTAIYGYNMDRFRITNCRVAGFAVGRAIGLSSVRNGLIFGNELSDYYTNLTWAGGGGQATAIEVGDINVGGLDAHDVLIVNNRVRDFTFGATALAALGYQTDGFNIIHGDNFIIGGNSIKRVAEGIDNFGNRHTISNNVFEEVFYFGIKMINGANNCAISGNMIYKPGLAGYIFQGGGVGGGVEGNSVTGGVVIDVDPDNIAVTDTSCITITGADVTNNNFEGIICDPGTNGDYVLSLSTLDSDSSNRIRVRTVQSGATGYVRVSGSIPAKTVLAADNATNVLVTMTAAQTISAAAITTVTFDTVSIDARDEFDAATNHLWTCQIPGWYRIQIQLRTGAPGTARITVNVLKNGGSVAVTSITPASGTEPLSFPLMWWEILCAEGDTLRAGTSVASGSYALSTGAGTSWMSITPVAN